MWTAINLEEKIDCRELCRKIDRDLLSKILEQNKPLKGHILYLEIKEPEATIEAEIPKITES